MDFKARKSLEEQPDIKYRPGQINLKRAHSGNPSHLNNNYYWFESKDQVKLTNLNNQNYQSNPASENSSDPKTNGEMANRRVVLPADKPIIGDSVSKGPNWTVMGLICYNVGAENNFHMHLQLSPGSYKDQVRLSLTFRECLKSSKINKDLFKDAKKYIVTVKLMGKDHNIIDTKWTEKELGENASWSSLNMEIDNFCSVQTVKIADKLYNYRIPRSTEGTGDFSGECDVILLEVDLCIQFKNTNKLNQFACFQSFQPVNICRRITNVRDMDEGNGLSYFKNPRLQDSSTRYSEIVVLRVGAEHKEMFAYRAVLAGRSAELRRLLDNGGNVLQFPDKTVEILEIFLDLLYRSGGEEIATMGGKSVMSTQTLCEVLAMTKVYQVALPSHVISRLVSDMTLDLPSAIEVYKFGQEHVFPELKQAAIQYFREHKEDLQRAQGLKVMEKVSSEMLVSILQYFL